MGKALRATLAVLIVLACASMARAGGLPAVGGFSNSSPVGSGPATGAVAANAPSVLGPSASAANGSANPLAAAALAALSAPCTMQAGSITQYVDDVFTNLTGPTVTWAGRSYNLALALYLFTSVFALVWFLLYVVPKAHHPVDLVRSLAFKLLSFGVFLFLINWAAGIGSGQTAAHQLDTFATNAAFAITGGQTNTLHGAPLTPGGLLSNGACDAWKITSAPMLAIIASAGQGNLLPLLGSAGTIQWTTVPVLMAAGMCMVVFVVLAAHLFLLRFAGELLAAAGVFILGFSGSPWTMPLAEGYWRFVWTNAISQFSLMLVALFANAMVDKAISNLVGTIGNGNIVGLYFSLIMMVVIFGFTLALAIAGPRFAVSLLSGAPALQMSDVISAGAATAGTVAMVATGAAGLAARAGLAAGAAGAGAGNLVAAGARREALGRNVVNAGSASARHAPSEGLTGGLVTTKKAASPSSSTAAKPATSKKPTMPGAAAGNTARANTAGVTAEVAAATAEVSGEIGTLIDSAPTAGAQSNASAIESAATGLAMAASAEPALIPAMAGAQSSSSAASPSSQLEAIGAAADSLSAQAYSAGDHVAQTPGGQIVAHKTRALSQSAGILATAARSLAATGNASVGAVSAVRTAGQAIAQLGRSSSATPRAVAAALAQSSSQLAAVSRTLATTPGVPASIAAQFVRGADVLAAGAQSVLEVPTADGERATNPTFLTGSGPHIRRGCSWNPQHKPRYFQPTH